MYPGKSLNIWQNPSTDTVTGQITGLETLVERPENGNRSRGWANKIAFYFWGSGKISIALPITPKYLTNYIPGDIKRLILLYLYLNEYNF